MFAYSFIFTELSVLQWHDFTLGKRYVVWFSLWSWDRQAVPSHSLGPPSTRVPSYYSRLYLNSQMTRWTAILYKENLGLGVIEFVHSHFESPASKISSSLDVNRAAGCSGSRRRICIVGFSRFSAPSAFLGSECLLLPWEDATLLPLSPPSLRLLTFYMIFVKTPTCLGDLGLSLYLQVPNLITSLKCHLLWKLVNPQVTLPVIWGMWHEDNRTGREPSVGKIRQGFDWSLGSQTRND